MVTEFIRSSPSAAEPLEDLKEKGIGSSVPPEKYEALEKENAKLKKEIEKLKADTSKE